MAGLCAAIECRKLGADVKVIDAGGGAGLAAAGMLAPVHELDYTETDLLQAGLAARDFYPVWLDSLDIKPDSVGLNFSGAIEVAVDAQEIPELKRHFEFQRQLGLNVEWMEASDLREKEPGLGPDVCAGVFAPQEGRVDPRLLLEQIKTRVENLVPRRAVAMQFFGGDLKITDDSGEVHSAKQLLLATGAGVPAFSSELVPPQPVPDLAIEGMPKIYPVLGEMLSVKGAALKTTVRIRSRRYGRGYIVPHPGRTVVGSTSEERGRDLTPTLGGLADVMHRAYCAVPALYDLPVTEIWTGLRPATLSRKPVMEKIASQVFVFNGLYRHGILLAPYLAVRMAHILSVDANP